ncbi:MAG: DinB family protein [Acidobacteriota bacterium]
MKRSEIRPMPQYFDKYINLVADVELSQAFDDSIAELNRLDINRLTELNGKRYAQEKWTIKEVIQHLTDVERILSYRTLLFARKDPTTPAGFDPDFLVTTANADRRRVEDLIDELRDVRIATKTLFASFDHETLLNKGINWKYEISVGAMGFNIIGHQIHHLKIVKEKYYPLLERD